MTESDHVCVICVQSWDIIRKVHFIWSITCLIEDKPKNFSWWKEWWLTHEQMAPLSREYSTYFHDTMESFFKELMSRKIHLSGWTCKIHSSYIGNNSQVLNYNISCYFEFDSFLFFWHFKCQLQKSPHVVLILIPMPVITSVLDFQATGPSFGKDPD